MWQLGRLGIVLCYGLVLSLAGLPAAQDKSENSSNATQQPANQKDDNPLKDGWVGDGRASDGTFLGLASLKTSNGTRVGLSHGTFRSAKAAQKELHSAIRNATRIMERGPLRDAKGHVVGERVVALFAKNAFHPEYNAVVWTKGPEYHWVTSPSLKVALKVEEQINSDVRVTGEIGPQKQTGSAPPR